MSTVPPLLDRWSGGCLVASGVLLVPGTLHPDIFETTLSHAALHSAAWVPIHVAALLLATLSLVGLSGAYLPRAGRLGKLGALGYGLVVPGLVMTGAVAWAEAFLLPVIAREHPEVFDWGGPVTTSWGVLVTTGTAITWWIGLVLLGLAFRRGGTVPAGAALTLAGGALLATAFAALLVPVATPVAVLVLAAGHAWVGAAVWTGTPAHGPTARLAGGAVASVAQRASTRRAGGSR
jgi:hypothetical protein